MSELDRVGASDDHGIDFGGEKAVLGNAWNGCDCQCGLPDVRDRPKRNVQDVVGLIGQERLIAQHPEGNRSSEISEARETTDAAPVSSLKPRIEETRSCFSRASSGS